MELLVLVTDLVLLNDESCTSLVLLRDAVLTEPLLFVLLLLLLLLLILLLLLLILVELL